MGKILSPDLLHAIASMGHGDEIVLADSNFPAASCCTEGPKLIDASGLHIPELLEAILKFFPLDTYVFNPVVLMDLVNSDKKKGDMEAVTTIWPKYQKICDEAEGRSIAMYKEEVRILQPGQNRICHCGHWRVGSLWKHHFEKRSGFRLRNWPKSDTKTWNVNYFW